MGNSEHQSLNLSRKKYVASFLYHVHFAVADPGFPRGGGANSRGAPTYDFAKFSQKLHEIERTWIPGWRPSRPP